MVNELCIFIIFNVAVRRGRGSSLFFSFFQKDKGSRRIYVSSPYIIIGAKMILVAY